MDAGRKKAYSAYKKNEMRYHLFISRMDWHIGEEMNVAILVLVYMLILTRKTERWAILLAFSGKK